MKRFIPFSCAIILLFQAFFVAHADWAPARGVAPAANANEAMNTGRGLQKKNGALILNDSNSPVGLLVPFGMVGIGIGGVVSALDHMFEVRGTSFFGGRVRISDGSGHPDYVFTDLLGEGTGSWQPQPWVFAAGQAGSVSRNIGTPIGFVGNVGIGTDVPSEKLEVNGNISVSGAVSGSNLCIGNSCVASLPSSTNNLVLWNGTGFANSHVTDDVATATIAYKLNATGDIKTTGGKFCLPGNHAADASKGCVSDWRSGPPGNPGQNATVAVNPVVIPLAYSSGARPTVTATGGMNTVWQFSIPQGPPGTPGTGVPGRDSSVISPPGTTVTVPYSATPTGVAKVLATLDSATNVTTWKFTLPNGGPGDNGPVTAGADAVVSVATPTTVNNSVAPSVSIGGASPGSNPVWTFTIPRGQDGQPNLATPPGTGTVYVSTVSFVVCAANGSNWATCTQSDYTPTTKNGVVTKTVIKTPGPLLKATCSSGGVAVGGGVLGGASDAASNYTLSAIINYPSGAGEWTCNRASALPYACYVECMK